MDRKTLTEILCSALWSKINTKAFIYQHCMYVKLMKDWSTHQDDLTTDHETNVLCYTGSKINQ